MRWRLTLWYAAGLGLGLVAFAGASLAVLARVLEHRSDRFLLAARGAFVAELLAEARELPTAESAIAAALHEVHVEETRFVVRPAPSGAAGAGVTLRTMDGGRRVADGIVAFDGRWWAVRAEHDRRSLRETVAAVAVAYAVSVPLLLAACVGGGYVLARRALAPVAAMTRRARAIEATTLHDRLPVANPHDELGELAGVVNALLARLEAAFAHQRRFVADASHELRTPVAILLAEADVALGRTGRSEAEYRDAVRVLREAGARLSRIVDDLFLLARADSGRYTLRREPLYLDELIADGVRAMRAVAGARGVRLECPTAVAADGGAPPGAAPNCEQPNGWQSDGEQPNVSDALDGEPPDAGAPFAGDPALLDRLLLNLLDNAVKYSPPGGTVRVALARLPGAYRLAVGDDGPGIPVEAQPHVFERFFRADRARTRTGADGGPQGARGGAGLGLAIARWVAEAHGGTLVLERSNDAGTTFAATLPAGSPAPPTPSGS